MALKRYNLLILLVALLLCFSLVFARVYDEKLKKELDGSNIGGAGGRAVDQTQSESGGADFLLKKKHCMHCKLFMKKCCGYFCCSAEEYARYMKGEAVLPHN
ncbi:hypothetical protein EJ110_NYTH40872 [Nymphaea thermarum]|nr:hypothetical protein EJ110_NYTH40872 [Nymphaea thermarum]